jgi:hypothetical protein
MTDEIDVVRDEDGVTFFGSNTAIERFLSANDLPSRQFDLPRLSQTLSGASGAANAAAQVAAGSGRWVKLTKESAKALDKFSAMKGSSAGVSRAIVTENGKIKNILEFTKMGSMLTSPAMLTGVAGIMAQLAMQQAMDEITDYLAKIDAKLDDVLRAQKDAAVADLIGVELIINDALRVRDRVGHVNAVTWSKVNGTEFTIARAQSYALLQLDALAEKLERTSKVGELADVTESAERTVHEWLAVLAQSFKLQEGVAILELDHVQLTAPEDLDHHRESLRDTRRSRRTAITQRTETLLGRIDAAARVGDVSVVMHPLDSRTVVRATNAVAGQVMAFHGGMGIEGSRAELESKRWRAAFGDAAEDARDRIVEGGADGVEVARKLGGSALEQAGNAAEAVSARLGGWASKLRRKPDDGDTGDAR